MDCVNCGGEGFNRVVVDLASGAELGSVCADCEGETFGITLHDRTLRATPGCVFCRGEERYALPLLECVIEWDDGSRPEREYAIDVRTPGLCERHLASLLRLDPTVDVRLAGTG